MLIKPELVNRIREYFDLNIYETKVWLSLLGKGTATAGELAIMSGVPRSRTYDVLESLEKKGFALIKVGKPVKYLAVKPELVVEKMKRNVFHSAEDKVHVLDNLKGTKEYDELETLHKASISLIKREDVSSALKGRHAIYSHAREISENATKEVVACFPASELVEKGRIFNNMFEKLQNNGIKVKLVLSGTDEEIKKAENKFKIKAIKTSLNSKFFLVDRNQVLFFLTNSNYDEDIAIWLNSDFFTSAFSSLFEMSLRR